MGFLIRTCLTMLLAMSASLLASGCGSTGSSPSSSSTDPIEFTWKQVGSQVSSSTAESQDPVMMLSTPTVGYRHASYVVGLNVWNGSSWGSSVSDPSNGNFEAFYGPINFCEDNGTVYLAFAHSGVPPSGTATFYDRVLAFTWTAAGGWQPMNMGQEVSHVWPGNQWDAYEPAVVCRPSQDPAIAWVEADDVSAVDNAYIAVVGEEYALRFGPINRNTAVGSYSTDVRVVGVAADTTNLYVAQWENDADDQTRTDLYVTQVEPKGTQMNLGIALDQDYDGNNLCSPSMIFYGGDLVIAYSAHRPRPGTTTNTRDIYVKRWDGSAWRDMGTNPLSAYATGEHYYANNPSLALAGNDLYIAWEEQDMGTYGSSIFVTRWDDAASAWVLEEENTRITEDMGAQALDPSLAYDGDDNYLYVACEAMISGHQQIYVMRRKLPDPEPVE